MSSALTTPKASVLLVDDDQLLAKMLTRSLRAAGFHVEVAESADGAFRVAAELSPSVLVADAVLPDGDGFSIARRLRSDNPKLGVVLMSGHEASELEAMGKPPPESEFLVKPFSKETLRSAVLRVCPEA